MEGFIQKVKEAVQNELGDSYEITETEDEEAIVSIAKRIVDTINNCSKPVIPNCCAA